MATGVKRALANVASLHLLYLQLLLRPPLQAKLLVHLWLPAQRPAASFLPTLPAVARLAIIALAFLRASAALPLDGVVSRLITVELAVTRSSGSVVQDLRHPHQACRLLSPSLQPYQ